LHNDIKHNDTQHYDIKYNDTQHYDIWHNNKSNVTLSITAVLLSLIFIDTDFHKQTHLLSVIMLNVVMMIVIMLSVVAPGTNCHIKLKNMNCVALMYFQ
jgi:hypothetical protein